MNRRDVDQAAFAREVEDPLLTELDAVFLTFKKVERETELTTEEERAFEALKSVLDALIFLRRKNIREQVRGEMDEN